MKYLSSKGEILLYKAEPCVVKRTLQFSPNDPDTFVHEDVLDIIWKVAGNLVQKVEQQPIYNSPDGRQVRAYDIYFLTGVKILYGKTAVNKLLAEMETMCVETLNVDMQNRTHSNHRVIEPNVTFKRRTHLRTS